MTLAPPWFYAMQDLLVYVCKRPYMHDATIPLSFEYVRLLWGLMNFRHVVRVRPSAYKSASPSFALLLVDRRSCVRLYIVGVFCASYKVVSVYLKLQCKQQHGNYLRAASCENRSVSLSHCGVRRLWQAAQPPSIPHGAASFAWEEERQLQRSPASPAK